MKQTSYANKGLRFEEILNRTHENYLVRRLGVIQKVPTEWKVLGNWNRGAVKVHPVRKGPCDYLGFARLPDGSTVGLAIEAKESHNETSFPFDREWGHEVEFLRLAHEQGAQAFMLINQVLAGRVWLLAGPELFRRWDSAFLGTREGRKSIPWRDLEAGAGQLVPSAPGYPVHYLPLLQLNGGHS